MDGRTYVKSQMRPLETRKTKKNAVSKNKRKLPKKFISIFKNKNFLREIWQLTFFSSISILLIILYLDQAWTTIKTEHIQINGLSGLTKKDIEKATNGFFPRNSLELNPKEIEASLIKTLPIKSIAVNRKFFPPGININILEREPVAFASRDSSNDVENGMIDIDGYWIPLKFVTQSKKNNTSIFVENWSPNKSNDIKLIIKNRDSLQSPLKKIKLNSNQELSIETKHFDSVLLGRNSNLLLEQINKLNQLQESLPNLLINTKVKVIDLKDPSKPELKIEKILPKGD